MSLDGPSDDLRNSTIRYYIGYVAEDKAANSAEISVFVPELLPGVTGALGAAQSTERFSVTTATGAELGGRAKVSNSIKAIYRGTSNRKYAPDVVKGEQVLITKFADADQYYWESLGRDAALRKLETLRIEVSDSEDIVKVLTDDNTYYWELDTRNGRVRIKTAKSNGESYAYDFHIDTKQSTATLKDDSGNEFLIDSKIPRVRIKNRDGVLMDAIQKLLFLGAPEDVVLKADRQVLFNTPTLTIGNSDGSGVTRMNTKALAVSASESVVFEAPVIGANGDMKVAGHLVSGPARAEGYSTGSAGAGYGGANTDLETGTGTIPKNVPDRNDTPGGRHATAWEQTSQAIMIIYDCLKEIHEGRFAGEIYERFELLPALAQNAIMEKNRGE